jgi:uncharacterized OB-fold protein
MDYAFEKVKITGGIGADDEYWRGLEEGEVRLQRCEGCRAWTWPAHYRCGKCGSWDFAWESVAPEGRIFTWTRSHYAFDRVSERAQDVPYVTAVVEIPAADGSRIIGIFDETKGPPRIGATVNGRILPPSDKSKGYFSIVWILADS